MEKQGQLTQSEENAGNTMEKQGKLTKTDGTENKHPKKKKNPSLFFPHFFPNSKTCYGVFSPEKLWCDPVQLQHQVPEKVPEGSGAFRCRLLMRFLRVPVQMADEVPDSSGAAG